jgi:predicted permease
MPILSDLRLAFRLWRRAPAVTVIAVLSIAVSVGAVSTVFAAVEAVLLRPLPYARPSELMQVRTDFRGARPAAGDWVFRDNALEIMRRNHTLASAGVWGNAVFDLAGGGSAPPEALYGLRITAGLLPTLGVAPMLGRGILPEEARAGNAVIILSYGLWMHRFKGDRGTIGRTVTIDGHACRIIGVMGPEFNFPLRREAAHTPQPYVEFWAPLDLEHTGPNVGLGMVARLRPGVSAAEAQQDLASISAALAREFPAANRDRVLRAGGLRERTIGSAGEALWLAMGAAALFLLIGCANLANLLLARGLARHREFAVRTALGAGRARIVRQLLTESGMLALAGGLGGYGLAAAAWKILPALAPMAIPRLAAARADGRVFLFALAAAIATGLLFGLAPAWRAAGEGELGARGAAAGRHDRMRGWLILAEVAITVVLATIGGQLLDGFVRLLGTDPGFAANRVLAAIIPVAAERYPTLEQRVALHRRIVDAVRAIPGVESLGTVDALPFSGENHGGWVASTPAAAVNLKDQLVAEVDVIGGEYLQTMGAWLEAGRWFREEEENNPASDTAMVDEVAMQRLWPGESAVGKRICVFCTPEKPDNWKQVIGVVSNMRHAALDGEAQPGVYLAGRGWVFLVLRTRRPEGEMQAAVRRAVASADPQQPVLLSVSMRTLVADSLAPRRFVLLLLAATGLLALALAAAGVYGVTAYTTSRRTQEIGIRLALGATPRRVHAMVFRQAFRSVGAGMAVGTTGSLVLERTLASLLPGLEVGSAADLWMAAAVVAAATALACWIPARRAMRVDPMEALRAE